jgi:lipopolysaccharide export system permease protein
MIIDRYIMREIIKPTMAINAVLIVIFGCYMATRFLADAIAGLLPGTTVILLILLRIVIAMEVLLPTTLYLSVVVALGRLYKDSEMTALFACGVGIGRVVRPVFFSALIITAIVASLSFFIRPLAYYRYYQLRANAELTFDLSRMNDETFYETADGGRIIYAEKVDHQRDVAKRVFIRTERKDSLQVIYARKASQSKDPVSGKQVMVFGDGYLYEFSRTGDHGRVLQFKKSAMYLEPKENPLLRYRVKAAPTGSIARSADPEEIAEFQWRLSTPLATIMLALLGVPLSRSSPRQDKYTKVAAAVVIFAVYYNLSALAKKWVEKGVLDAFPGIWWIQFMMAGLLLYFYWQPMMVFFRRGRS